MDSIRQNIIWIALLAQALVLAPRLDLLPIWGDERYTLETAVRPPAQILEALRVDVHPPLYYFLVKGWLKLPLPGSPLERVRALSAVTALLATAAFYHLWVKTLPFASQELFLGLWVLSPFLTLYARMARSYTLQLLLTVVAIKLARDWLRSPANAGAMACYIAAAVVLLYTHYLPGLGVVAGTAALGLWRRQWRHVAALAAMAVLYAPWLGVLVHTSGMVARGHPYWVSSSVVVENAMKLGYAFVAFNFGESVPWWAMVAAAGLLPGVAWSLWRAWRQTVHPPVLFLLVAAIGYLGAARWVTFAFVGARLLFLLPFYYLFLLRGLDVRRWHGAALYTALLVVDVGGLASYYRRQDFLNKGYLVDFEEIARQLRENSPAAPAVVLLDRQISNAGYYLHSGFPYPIDILDEPASFERALAHLRHHRPALVWYLRYGRDLTSERLHHRLEHGLAGDYAIDRRGFVPFSPVDHLAMQALGLADIPTYLIEVLVLRPRTP